ncbi:MAG: hypothetical protein ACREAZ_03960 [Nitrososphaera sp.]
MVKKDDGLEKLATVVGIGAGLATIAGYFKRTTCSCDGNRLPLFGDRSLFGPRYCNRCGHNH